MVTPLGIEEDSRCPVDVQCIQAGTVRLSVKIDRAGEVGTSVLTLNSPIHVKDEDWLELAAVCPITKSTVSIPSTAYRFLIVGSPASTSRTAELRCP